MKKKSCWDRQTALLQAVHDGVIAGVSAASSDICTEMSTPEDESQLELVDLDLSSEVRLRSFIFQD